MPKKMAVTGKQKILSNSEELHVEQVSDKGGGSLSFIDIMNTFTGEDFKYRTPLIKGDINIRKMLKQDKCKPKANYLHRKCHHEAHAMASYRKNHSATKILVKFERDSIGRIQGFEATNCSNFNNGDIISTAVSVLTNTVILGLNKHLQREMDCNTNGGFICVRLKGSPDELTEAVMSPLILGLSEIQKLYPKRIRIL